MFPQTVRLLLALRWKVGARSCARSPSALLSTLLIVLVAGSASVAAAQACRAQWETLPPAAGQRLLGLALLALQGAWLLLLILPGGGVTALGQNIPISVLRPFGVRPLSLLGAAMVGALLDVPLLLALPLFAAILGRFGANAIVPLALLCVQTVALGQVIEQAGILLSRRRRATLWPLIAGVLLFGLYFALPPALASVTPPPPPRLSFSTPVEGASQARKPGFFIQRAATTWLLPSGLAARGITGTSSVAAPVGLGVLTALTLYLALRLLGATLQLDGGTSSGPGRYTSHRGGERDISSSPSASGLSQVMAVAGVETRLLLRNPRAHLGLREPASLLLTVFYAWLAQGGLSYNFGKDLWDLTGMGVILYALVWQVQLLCNRFGNESGTTAPLLSLPVPRIRLLLGKNLALGGLLLLFDGFFITGLCVQAQAFRASGPFLAWLPAVLITATAIGNVLTPLAPFPLRKRQEGFQPEPERSIAFLYVLVALATWGLLVPIARMLSYAQPYGIAATFGVVLVGAAYLGTLYTLSLLLSSRLLVRRELTMIRLLDRS